MRSTRPPTPNRAAERGAAGERDEAAGVPIEILEGERALALRPRAASWA